MTDAYPWDDLRLPLAINSFTRRLIDENSRWDTYWVIDMNGDIGLMLDCGAKGMSLKSAPKLRELEVRYLSRRPDDFQILFILKDVYFKELFFEFCKGLHENIEAEDTVQGAATEAVNYTWNWYRFLQGRKLNALSPEAQRGLIGEMIYLRDYLAPAFTWKDALGFWGGPFGNPKDFAWCDSAVEVKTHLNDAQPFLKISSEYQLETVDVASLWLFVLGFQRDAANGSESLTLNELVQEITDTIGNAAPDTVESFYNHILASGYSPKHDYSEYRWSWDNPRLFRVGEGFPSIQSVSLATGVLKVAYQIALSACEPFKMELGKEFAEASEVR